MRKPVRLLPAARTEFNDAADWYEQQKDGLGPKFVAGVRDVLERIASAPERHATVYQEVRKVLVPKFPYVILYRDDAHEVLVISVFHTSRDPSVWKSRT